MSSKASSFQKWIALQPTRVTWVILLIGYLLTGLLFSIIQPLGRAPDEPAHMQYVAYLSEQKKFPIWQEHGGGEAGYESQQPPLFYLYSASVYNLTSSLSENWRWHINRWAMLLVGCALFAVCYCFFESLFGRKNQKHIFIATATVMLMPLTILYTSHVNPDGFTLLWVALGLFLAWRSSVKPPTLCDLILLGVVCGFAALSKLSGAPILLIALITQLWHIKSPSTSSSAPTALHPWLRILIITLSFLATCGWWYIRSILLYGSAFIHTAGKLGTGTDMAERKGIIKTALFTWSETFLSTWIQRGWLPVGFWSLLFYSIIIVIVLFAVFGLQKARTTRTLTSTEAADAQWLAIKLSCLLVVLVFLGHQWAFWTVDVEFNAGGRYILVAMPAIAALLTLGLSPFPVRWRQALLGIWLCALPIMSIVSAWNIDTVLNPRYAPDWEIFQFPPGESPDGK